MLCIFNFHIFNATQEQGWAVDEKPSLQERGFVSFIDERKAMRYPTKRRVKEEEDTKKKKVKHKGAPGAASDSC